ncbi:Receptor-type tyrosine-protein phosphatase mu [Trachymyrmex septentrionalis]|uniref:protein-tyrosine-phosphatase n=1 Tax=Trachymyrmex septentrionalis TaxID=34720 RepID=A0A195FP51_9HYME|nr:Receptor-type tyrosine-protein phosphatase mu [Trachymyrmex septentrionalis]
MNANISCLKAWTKYDWYLTNSLKTPMGPVFDQRWEEFEEYKNLQDTYEYVNKLPTAEVKLSFSVRASHNAHILICNDTNYLKGSCYWIIIGGWDNTLSVIRKCATGVPLPGEFPAAGSKCKEPLVSFKKIFIPYHLQHHPNHKPLSESEWRTFVITWNSMIRRIIVYDTDKIIMTYVDEEGPSNITSNNYYMFIRSVTAMLFRFHIYDFLHTTVENALLTSPVFQFNNRTMCIQLLIGLCAECEANIILHDFTNNNVFVTVTAKGSKAIHGLPMWQSVKIKINSSAIDYNTDSKMIIKLIPKLNKYSSNPLWAIANVRQCSQNGALREGFMISGQDWNNQLEYFWPNETCQKLFYDEHATINHLSRVKFDVNLDTNCPEGKIGPQCLFSCTHHLSSNSDCKGTELCFEDGCTCAPACDAYTYGHGCMKTCGFCFYNKQCNKANGECSKGCNNNSEKVYISPLCQTSVDKPDKPTIISISETTIHTVIPITWKDEYDKISIHYSFDIRTNIEYIEQPWNELFRNMTQLTGNFENLEPGVIYHIGLILNITGIKIHSDWEVAETKCNPVENFNITPKENSITINWQLNPTQLYSCPISWYYLTVYKIDTSTVVSSLIPTSFEYELKYLPSYTSFEVNIYHKNYKFSQEIHTLEGVPSKVTDLQSMLSANTELILIWRAPLEPNGKIEKYEVFLKVVEYFGCKNLKISIPTNHTITNSITNIPTITIRDLHPYRSYSAQVRAYNSRHFSMFAETTFKTAHSEIPSEVFSQLTMQNWKLSWSPPEDCTTISGSLKARIRIHGISDAVKYFNITKQTSRNYIDLSGLDPKLNGLEQYMAIVYVIREFMSKENASAYKKIEFETPPTAPPRVTNLEVVEIDTRQNSAMIHLRWRSPLPPLNGKLRVYGVQLCNTYNKHCSDIQVQFNEFCDLWDDYICKVIHEPFIFSQMIKVFAYNMDVTEPGHPVFVTRDMLHNTTPDAPGNYTFTINNNSVVDLKWLHPWRTGAPLESFRIRIVETSSNLRRRLSRSFMGEIFEYPVTQYMRNYSKQLYLFPSTQYTIYIQTVTIENKSSNTKFVDVHTPSTAAFDGVLDVKDKFDSTILLDIPFVINDTQDSMMYVIVKGHNPCKQYLKMPEKLRTRAGIKINEIAWLAAEASTSEFAGKQFTVGDNYVYGNAKNCPLKSKGYYEIVIIVTERNLSTESIMLSRSVLIGEVPPKHHEAWLIPVILLLVVAGVAFYLYRRKKQKLTEQLMQDEMILSQNIENFKQETKSSISNSKQNLASSDRQSLSQTIIPEVPIAANNNEEKAEMTSLVKVKDFENYVRQAIQSGLLDKQYETFSRGQTKPWDYGKLPQNKSKNRYGNLIAYDETRVILKKLPDDAHSDYINANYITGYKKDKHYIATQGPKPNTVIDFWRMIWQENVLIICMLANVVESGKKKCEQYWPDIGKKKKYGDIIVLNAKHNVFADYCFRTFNVTCGEETRKIEHLHYTAWPDHGVPLYTHSVVTYLKKLLATPTGIGPVVVHCSAGVGRTGTIILCDICLRRAAAEGLVDVFTETASIRSERANMVDNKQQYLLAHLALVECLLSIPTTLPCNEMLLTQIKALKKQLPLQQQRLQNTAWQDEALRQIISPPSLSEYNRVKNRFPELISGFRIYLKRYPASDEDSDYLSAVYVDGVKVQNQYLASQLPMPSTINDFWRMIAEFKVELILMLQPPDFQDPTCCAIAPTSGEFKPVPYLNIIMKEVVELEYYTSQKLLLIDNSEKPSREQFVTILCLTEWKPGKDQPPPPVITMVTLWQAAERIARGDGPTVTLCHDGVTGCGLYLALSFLLERMAVERECDVSLAVRAVRRSRPDFVHSLRKKLSDVYGEDVLTERQCQNWFAKFRSGNFDVEDASRSGRPVEADEDTIKALIDKKTKLLSEQPNI